MYILEYNKEKLKENKFKTKTMGDLRSKYKKQAVKLTDLKSKQNAEDQAIGYGGSDYLEIN